MKKLVCLAFLLLFPLSVQAAVTATEIPVAEQQTIKDYFGILASNFGCTKLAREQFSNINLAELEFLPPGETTYAWTKVFTVTVQQLPDSAQLATAAMNSFNSTLVENYIKRGDMIASDLRKASDGSPVTYIEYKANRGGTLERGILVYGRHTPTMAALTKYVVNFGLPDEGSRGEMRKLADVLASK